jgi:hypothetical protein
MYVHIPQYESKGSLTPSVVNRCLAGVFISQLTMMGVLALKYLEEGPEATVTDYSSWSGYAKMVIGVTPLLFITVFVYSMLSFACEKHIRNIPLEILGKLQNALEKENSGSEIQQQVEMQEFIYQKRSESGSDYLNNIDHREGENTDFAENQESLPLLQEYDSFDSQDPASPFHNPNDVDPILETLDPGYEEFDPLELTLLESHIETPMTRVSGILDMAM